MRLLFALSVASFCTVLWLALALARRVRRGQRARGAEQTGRKHSPFANGMEFFEAGDFRTPRSLRLNQDIAQQGIRRSRNDDSAPAERPEVHGPAEPPHKRAALLPIADAAHRKTPHMVLDKPAAAPSSSEAVIVDSKLQFLVFQQPSLAEKPDRSDDPKQRVAPRNTLPRDISHERKAPQSARSGTFRRVDLSHYNKESGDLTDPYTHSQRNSGIGPGIAKSG